MAGVVDGFAGAQEASEEFEAEDASDEYADVPKDSDDTEEGAFAECVAVPRDSEEFEVADASDEFANAPRDSEDSAEDAFAEFVAVPRDSEDTEDDASEGCADAQEDSGEYVVDAA